MNARRYPRTMDAAFGPYNRSSTCQIVPMADKNRTGGYVSDWVIGTIFLAVVVALTVGIRMGWIV